MTLSYPERVAKQLDLRTHQVAAAIELLDSGNTVPFIARYRKEMTGTLDEEQLRQIQTVVDKLRSVDERRTAILASIEEQGKLTPELTKALAQAETLTALEDLYAPYKPKRRTRASIAREKGLQALADLILTQAHTTEMPEQAARKFLSDSVATVEDALSGARDIAAETISEHAEVRRLTRERAKQWAVLRAEKIEAAEDARQVYQMYYAFEARIEHIRPHQTLALNRGETEKVLRVKFEMAERDWQGTIGSVYRADRRSPYADQLTEAIADAAERLLLPAIERDIRRALTETAETHAINVFALNLRGLLLQPPLSGYTVLGLDPGFRTGCKVAVVGPTGKMLATDTIYPHEPQKRKQEALVTLRALVEKYHITLISIGNGTASRETEQLSAELCRELPGVRYLITSEAGASVYSASPLARAELPTLDVSLRGAVSIARRVQDPLAELVKIDPRSIGVGLYQHDVDQNRLTETLTGVVEDVVNRVGVDVNTASPALLTYVSGIGPKLAEKIVAYRDETGPFTSRTQLRKVPTLGPKAYEQCAGFLRIRAGDNPLDETAIHPESYPAAEKVLKLAGVSLTASADERRKALDALRKARSLDLLAGELGVGVPTLLDIFDQILRPGRDPRADLPAPILRSDVLKMEDLVVGMVLKGTVRNVVDFGAFVDIGVKQDGLLHRSQITAGTLLQVGDIIEVEVLKVEIDRGRIALKMG